LFALPSVLYRRAAIVDTAGQVDRFMRRLRTSQDQQAEIARRRAEREKPEPKKRSLLKEIYGEEA